MGTAFATTITGIKTTSFHRSILLQLLHDKIFIPTPILIEKDLAQCIRRLDPFCELLVDVVALHLQIVAVVLDHLAFVPFPLKLIRVLIACSLMVFDACLHRFQ